VAPSHDTVEHRPTAWPGAASCVTKTNRKCVLSLRIVTPDLRLRTAPAAGAWDDAAATGFAQKTNPFSVFKQFVTGGESSLFDFVGMGRAGRADGTAAAEKLREEFNSLLAGEFLWCCFEV
jgi:hypothetical protein